MDYENKIKELEEELIKTKEELTETKERLKKYTAPARSKTFYENHKEEIIQKVKDYKKNTNYTYNASPEQKKMWARTAYLNKKEKLKKMNEQIL
jgi:ABC-type glycerol-3-phosphate transport system substrate-binding protein